MKFLAATTRLVLVSDTTHVLSEKELASNPLPLVTFWRSLNNFFAGARHPMGAIKRFLLHHHQTCSLGELAMPGAGIQVGSAMGSE